MYHKKNWVQQFHLGALRNNNSRLLSILGKDSGVDSIGDFPQAYNLAVFLNALDKEDNLASTILYNLNPSDNEVFATMCGNFQGVTPGKIQWGSAWWFLDQKDGIEKQLNALSNIGLLSRFVGMVTDSRSFLSFSRHDYFRRILCNIIGTDMEKGLLPSDTQWLGKMLIDISYKNAEKYFDLDSPH
jgi:glucuronate isomerase